MKKLINLIGKTLIIFILYLFADIALMKLLPNDIKGKIYDKRTHKIKSYYYHHDLRPNAHWIERWGYKNSKIFTNNLGFKDKEIRQINFKDNNILFIGDSFTEGVGVEFENTFVGIIEKNVTSKKNNYTVLNAGVTSYSPIVILSKLNYILEKKIPISKVFVVICGADFHDDIYRYISIDENYIANFWSSFEGDVEEVFWGAKVRISKVSKAPQTFYRSGIKLLVPSSCPRIHRG